MFFIFFCFLFLVAIEIEISTEIGAKHYSFDLAENDVIFIKSIFYPFLLILNQFADDTTLSEYFSLYNNETANFQSTEVYLRLLPIYKIFSTPFTFIRMKSSSESQLKFTIVSFPSMCHNGIYVSTKESDKIQFSSSATDFFKLRANDDKCVVFGSHNTQTVSMELESDDYEDQMLLYTSYDEWISFSGNGSITYTQKDEMTPIFLRIVAGEIAPPASATILFHTYEDNNGSALYQDFQYHGSFVGTVEAETTTIGSKPVAVVVLTLTVVLFFIDTIFITIQCLRRPQYTAFDSTENELSSMVVDIEVQPNSKFDISRFSNKDLIVY